MILAASMLIAAAGSTGQVEVVGASGVPIGKRTRVEARYDKLYDCYVGFMESKGFDLDTPDEVLARWDRRARVACARQVRRYRQVVSARKFEIEWSEIWSDHWSRL